MEAADWGLPHPHIMASRGSQLTRPLAARLGWAGDRRGAWILLLLLSGAAAAPVAAQAKPPSPSPNQPEAIDHRGLTPPPCPLIVPPSSLDSQPLRISPNQVPLKNRMGCLSEADAVYGPDGCPLRLCDKSRNPIALPRF